MNRVMRLTRSETADLALMMVDILGSVALAVVRKQVRVAHNTQERACWTAVARHLETMQNANENKLD
jgi:hypothetical protein